MKHVQSIVIKNEDVYVVLIQIYPIVLRLILNSLLCKVTMFMVRVVTWFEGHNDSL